MYKIVGLVRSSFNLWDEKKSIWDQVHLYEGSFTAKDDSDYEQLALKSGLKRPAVCLYGPSAKRLRFCFRVFFLRTQIARCR